MTFVTEHKAFSALMRHTSLAFSPVGKEVTVKAFGCDQDWDEMGLSEHVTTLSLYDVIEYGAVESMVQSESDRESERWMGLGEHVYCY